MQAAVAQGRRIICLAGSGRTTDEVLAALQGKGIEDERLQTIVEQGNIMAFPIADGAKAFRALIRQLLFEWQGKKQKAKITHP